MKRYGTSRAGCSGGHGARPLKSYEAAKRENLPSVEHRQHRYLNNCAENAHRPTRIVAGPPNDTGDFTLYQWSGASSEVPEPIPEVTVQGLHPEALIMYPGERTKIQILSDDGEVQVEGRDCKHKKVELAKKSFRSVWATP
jgi:hypothetical protein